MKETTILANTFHNKKFLCFFGLRPGTIFLLYYFMIINYFYFLILFNLWRLDPDSSGNQFLLLPISGVNLMSVILMSYVSLYFPEINKKYEKKSVNARCAMYLFCYTCVATSICSIVAIISSSLTFFMSSRYLHICLISSFYSTLLTVVFVHFTGTTYSFYLSILTQDDKHQEYEELSTENSNAMVFRKNCNLRAPNTVPQPPPKPVLHGECSSNVNGTNGNLYVELPL